MNPAIDPAPQPQDAAAAWLQWLEAHPIALEPGLVLQPGPLEIAAGVTVPLCGHDLLGRPCLILFEQAFRAEFFDRLLEIVACLRADPGRFSAWCARPLEPRVFVVAPGFPDPVLQRFELLGRAFDLRLFQALPSEHPGLERRLLLRWPEEPAAAEAWLQRLEPGHGRQARRILQAARAIRPPLLVQGPAWPVVLTGRNGPCAALHCDQGRLLLVMGQGGEPELMEMGDDEAGDAAIDFLMREQWTTALP